MTQASGLKENDKSLQAVAEGHLREDLNSSIEILGAKLVGKVHVEGKEKEYLTITVTGKYDYGLIVSAILNEIQSAVGKELPGTKVDVKGNGSWTKIGVVVRTDGTPQLHSSGVPDSEPRPQVNNNSSSFPPACGCKAALRGFFVPVGRGEAPAPFCAVTKAAGKAKAAACLPKGTRLLFVCLAHRHRKPPEVSLPTVLCMMIGGSKNDRHIIAA